MKALKQLFFLVCLLEIGIIQCSAQSQIPSSNKDKKYSSLFKSMSAKIDEDRIRKEVFYLAKDPLPQRALNYTIPGHTLSTLEEADAWIIQQLKNCGYKPVTDSTRVHAFGRDFTKPRSQQYARPAADAPWYTARNIIVNKQGTEFPNDLIIIIAHKDSQSWLASPAANDNAVGTCGALELATVLKKYKPRHTLRFIFCNEEHTPWTSITAAASVKASGLDILALINVDGIGVKAPQQKGMLTNVTCYTTPEGEKIADLMDKLNKRHNIGLVQTKFHFQRPSDDDGSFIKAGFPWAVLNIGSIPFGDPNYHTEDDVAENVDIKNAERTVQLTLAAILYLDTFGRP